jgi:CheY-like chemotaxis protein
MPSRTLAGCRVLVLENEYYLAADASALLQAEGATVLGPFSDTAKAIEAAEQSRPSCALLDIKLSGGPDFVLARALASRGIPFIFVTGYEAEILPPDLARVPLLRKPFTEATLVEATVSMCERAARRSD